MEWRPKVSHCIWTSAVFSDITIICHLHHSSPWIWKGVSVTLQRGRCTLSYPEGRIMLLNDWKYCNWFDLFWPTAPVLEEWGKDLDARIAFALKQAKHLGFLMPKSSVVLVTGWHSGSGYTNTIRVIECESPAMWSVRAAWPVSPSVAHTTDVFKTPNTHALSSHIPLISVFSPTDHVF